MEVLWIVHSWVEGDGYHTDPSVGEYSFHLLGLGWVIETKVVASPQTNHTSLGQPCGRGDLDPVDGDVGGYGREADHAAHVLQEAVLGLHARAHDHDVRDDAHAARAQHGPPFVDGVEGDRCREPPTAHRDQMWLVGGHPHRPAGALHHGQAPGRGGRGRGRRGRGGTGGGGVGVSVEGATGGGAEGGSVGVERDAPSAAYGPSRPWARGGVEGRGRGRGRSLGLGRVGIGEGDVQEPAPQTWCGGHHNQTITTFVRGRGRKWA